MAHVRNVQGRGTVTRGRCESSQPRQSVFEDLIELCALGQCRWTVPTGRCALQSRAQTLMTLAWADTPYSQIYRNGQSAPRFCNQAKVLPVLGLGVELSCAFSCHIHW